MKKKVAAKLIYKYDFFTSNKEKLEGTKWEERIILIDALSLDKADEKVETLAKEYERTFINTDNETVVVSLYEIVDLFQVFETNNQTNIEVYSNIFDAEELDLQKALNIIHNHEAEE